MDHFKDKRPKIENMNSTTPLDVVAYNYVCEYIQLNKSSDKKVINPMKIELKHFGNTFETNKVIHGLKRE